MAHSHIPIGHSLLALSLLVAASGCTNDLGTNVHHELIWDESGGELLFNTVWSSRSERRSPVPDDLEFVEHESEIRMVTANGEDKGALISRRRDLFSVAFYMRAAGYAILSHHGEDGFHWIRVTLDGETAELGRGLGPPVVPSPDGSVLARLRFVDCEAPSLEGTPCVFQVRWLDAMSLEDTRTPVQHTFTNTGRALGILWTADGRIVVHSPPAEVAIALTPDGVVSAFEPVPTCFEPATSSSFVRADGTVAVVQSRNPLELAFETPGYTAFPSCTDP